MMEPTLLAPLGNLMASVGLASHWAALLRLAPMVLKTHRAG